MMKKYVAILIVLTIWILPSQAATKFFQDKDTGEVFLIANDCRSLSRLANLKGIPDDPPSTSNTGTSTEGYSEEDAQTDILQGGLAVVNALLTEPQDTVPSSQRNHEVSEKTEKMLDTSSFDERQDAFITFVRDVNWKTGMYITFRDYNFFYRLKMACSGINQLTKPMRMNLGIYTEELDQTINQVTDKGVDQLASAAREHSFAAMSKLSIVGLAIAIEKENPFLLLALDQETYDAVVEFEPKIADLYENMYSFFKIRSVRMGDYNKNIKALNEVSKIGKGDAFHTWQILAEYAEKMLKLKREGALSVDEELKVHIWRLESSMNYVKEYVRVEKRAAQLAAQDPGNAALVREVENGPKKKPSVDDKARELLRKSTQDEIKHLIQKYITK